MLGEQPFEPRRRQVLEHGDRLLDLGEPLGRRGPGRGQPGFREGPVDQRRRRGRRPSRDASIDR